LINIAHETTIDAGRSRTTGTKVLNQVLFFNGLLNQPQLSGPNSGFSPTFYLKFVKDVPVVSLHRAQCEKQVVANFAVGQAPGDKIENLELPKTQSFNEKTAGSLFLNAG